MKAVSKFVFLMIGCIAFGNAYAASPVIQLELIDINLHSAQDFDQSAAKLHVKATNKFNRKTLVVNKHYTMNANQYGSSYLAKKLNTLPKLSTLINDATVTFKAPGAQAKPCVIDLDKADLISSKRLQIKVFADKSCKFL